jgi:hypothetical protein
MKRRLPAEPTLPQALKQLRDLEVSLNFLLEIEI